VLHCVAVCRSVLQCVAVFCSESRVVASAAACKDAGVLQCVAVCCSVLQCVAVCCNALQCIAKYHPRWRQLQCASTLVCSSVM